jgi:hypothetical protein
MHIGYVNYNVRAAMIISDMEKKGAPKGAFLYLMPRAQTLAIGFIDLNSNLTC